MPNRNYPLVITCVFTFLGAILLLVVVRMQPPDPVAAGQADGQFSADRAFQRLQEILAGELPHPVDSVNNQRVRERIVVQMQAMGYDTQIQTAFSCHEQPGKSVACATVRNILAQWPGKSNAPAVVLLAHYDSVPAGPGVADNGAGVATALEIAELMGHEGPFRNPLRFVFSDAEEFGLLGARAFIKKHPWASQIAVLINLEARGTAGQSLLFETSADNNWLINHYASSVKYPATSSLMVDIYRLLPNDTDFTVFRKAGIAGLNFAFIEHASAYHTAQDNLANLDLGSLQHHGENVLPVLRRFVAMDLSSPPSGDATYIDMLGFSVIGWPAYWTFPLALMAGLLLVLECVWLMLQRQTGRRQLAWGFLAAILTVLSPIIPGMLLVSLISYIWGTDQGWMNPWPLHTALWSLAILASMCSAQLFIRRAGFLGLGLGAWLLWTLMALLLSIWLPGASIVFLLPVLLAVCLLGIGQFWAWRIPQHFTIALKLGLLAASIIPAILWLRLALQLETALGLAMNYSITFALALPLSLLMPFFAAPDSLKSGRNGWVTGIAAIVVLSALYSLVLPGLMATAPKKLNILFVEDFDKKMAYWFASPQDGNHTGLTQALNSVQPQIIFPWDKRRFPASRTHPSKALPPELSVLSDVITHDGRQITAILHTKRSADQIRLYLPVNALHTLDVRDRKFLMPAGIDHSGLFRFQCYGRSCDGLKIVLHVKSATPMRVYLVDIRYGLPSNLTAKLRENKADRTAFGLGDQTWIFRRYQFD